MGHGFDGILLTHLLPFVWMVLLPIFSILLLLGIFYRFSVPASRRVRLFLLFLRIALAAGVFLLILDPYWKRSGENKWLGVLADTSASMAVIDRGANTSRLDQIINYLETNSYWQMLKKKYPPKYFTFDDSLSETAILQKSQAVGTSSGLITALRELNQRYSGDPDLLGWIIFTDGNVTDGPTGEAEVYAGMTVPWIAVGMGASGPVPNVAVRAPVVRESIFTGEVVPLIVRWDSNFTEPVSTVLQVMADGQLYEKRQINLADQEARIDLSFDQAGNHSLDIELVPLTAEGSRTDNSVRTWVQAVPREARVFYGESFYKDINLFKKALEEDRDFKVTFASSLVGFAREKLVPFIKDPFYGFPKERDELMKYDAVVLSDVKRSLLSLEQIEWIRELVQDHGGALIMVGGMDSFGDGGYGGTEIEKMLPVEISEDYKKDTFLAAQGTNDNLFRPVVTEEAKSHFLVQLTDRPEDNEVLWQTMPFLGGYNYVGRLKPGATMILRHPSDRGNFGSRVILAVQSYGKGRTMAFTSDITPNWGADFQEWRDEKEGWLYACFWRRALKWLTENRLRERMTPVAIEQGPPLLEASQPMRFVITPPKKNKDTSGQVLNMELLTRGKVIRSEEIKDESLAESIVWDISELLPGDYRLKIFYTAKAREPLNVERPFTVHPSRIESRHLEASPHALKVLSGKTNGFYLPMSRIQHLPNALSRLQKEHLRRFSTPFWNQPFFYFLLLALFFTDWFVRKRKGLE
jgi:uncharacterized membrane protein